MTSNNKIKICNNLNNYLIIKCNKIKNNIYKNKMIGYISKILNVFKKQMKQTMIKVKVQISDI